MKKISPLVIGLLVSVALNGVLIGMLASQGNDKGPRSNTERPRTAQSQTGGGLDIETLSRTLPTEQRKTFASGIDKETRERVYQAFREVNIAQRELGRLSQSETVNMQDIIDQMSIIREKRYQVATVGDKVISDYLASLSSDERKALLISMGKSRRGNGTRTETQRGDGAMGDGNRENREQTQNGDTPE